ncbi:MAG: DUF6273 domain-containing protein [Firmicutes bacterium]|nr:DUF6273 domain-containing protein [Bacillota bacterium]
MVKSCVYCACKFGDGRYFERLAENKYLCLACDSNVTFLSDVVFKKGGVVTFGRLENSKEISKGAGKDVGKEISKGASKEIDKGASKPIKWRILEAGGNRLLLLSESILFSAQFDTSRTGEIHWGNSWLNTERLNKQFLNEAFTDLERAAIVHTLTEQNGKVGELDNSKDSYAYVFLLNHTEMLKYIKDIGVDLGSGNNWWLRNKGDFNTIMVALANSGKTQNFGYTAENGVRPAIWLDTSLLGEQKHNLLKQDYIGMKETTYLKSIPGMWDSILEGINTPIGECVEIDKL